MNKEEFEKFEKEQEELNEKQKKLMSVEDIKTGLNDMVKDFKLSY